MSLIGAGEAVVDVFAETDVEVPVASLDFVFDIKRKLLNGSVAEVGVVAAAAREVIGRKDGEVVGVLAEKAAWALRLVGIAGNRVATRVNAWSVIEGIDDCEVIVLAEEGL